MTIRTSPGAGVADFVFGCGSDGAIAYDTGTSRWRDGAGAEITAGHALVTSGKVVDPAGGATLVMIAPLNLASLTVGNGSIFQVGRTGYQEYPVLRVRGTCLTKNGGTLRAGIHPYEGSNVPATLGYTTAARKTVAGNGNGAYYTNYGGIGAGRPGGSGAGGGDGTNSGGAGARKQHNTSYFIWSLGPGSNLPAGTTGAGSSGTAAGALSGMPFSFSYFNCPRLCGMDAFGGGGGSVVAPAGGAYGGAGGQQARGGGILDIAAYRFEVEAGGVVHANGEDGYAGENGYCGTPVAAGCKAGGGAGGGGAGGGTVCIGYGPGGYSMSGTLTANGGAAGAKGLGKEESGGAEVNRATSDGGAGTAGGSGIIVTEKILC
jgi:hypothetical protein